MTSSPRPPLPEGSVLVVGLARSGRAAARALSSLGRDVTVVDSGTPVPGDVGDARIVLNSDGVSELEHARWVVKSPGVPRQAPVIAKALEEGLPVLGELEVGWRLLGAEFIAVTGTNGKTTTTELLGHIHRTAGIPAQVAGNVGTALTELVDTDAPLIIAECSSFQLEDSELFAPEGAILLNIDADHLDRHGTFDLYLQAKLRVFAHQGNDDIAVVPSGHGIEDLGGCARRITFGDGLDSEMSVRAGELFWAHEPLIAVSELGIRGAHNVQNSLAAAAMCLARGIEPEAVAEGLRTFRGVEHRLEDVGEYSGVQYVNDSKATNISSTVVALQAFAGRRVHLILGGEGKAQDFSVLKPVTDQCAGVYLIGAAAEEIAEAIGSGEQCGTLEAAVERARAQAVAGEVVLLSPACASFDQFADFEARGRAFKELVR
ncbi:MAG TPA: UDP-N-acetylmuramoyl-L-alanine--D-glutamate ligase [Baekduia sp.]|nr:UDP-N-acetylmuramoyl-L-alanine--D-glutamate ligase [Baekduia sp.]